MGVECHLAHFDTKAYAELHKVSIEMAARDLRYNYFEQLRRDLNAEGICVAHHKNDNVETVLINLLRGTGIHGMTGIHPVRGKIIRPLLCVSRDEIESWLKAEGQDYVTDSTNMVNDVMRNKVRNIVLPMLKEIAPNAVENILTMQQQMTEAEAVYDAKISEDLDRMLKDGGTSINIDDLLTTPSPQCTLYEWLKNYGFSPATIRQIATRLDSPSGKCWESESHTLFKDRDSLVLSEKKEEMKPFVIPEDGTYMLADGRKLRVKISDEVEISRDSSLATLDAAKVRFPLTLRHITNGDRFIPFGMKGSKLVSDYLTDRHLNIFEKRRTLVVCDANQQIIWLVGHRPDANFCLTDNTTETLSITIEIQKCEGK
jgi:tRNA(Ile)-lysidine synthase